MGFAVTEIRLERLSWNVKGKMGLEDCFYIPLNFVYSYSEDLQVTRARQNCGRIKLFLTFITVMLCAGCGAQFSTPTAIGTPESVIDVEAMKVQVGMVFIPAKPSDIVKVKISRAEAITKAKESGAPVQQASAIFTALGFLSEPSLETAAANGEPVDPALLAHPLVWIISYEGLDLPSAGGPNSPHTTAHEYNVVINATKGDYIMAFVYQTSLYIR